MARETAIGEFRSVTVAFDDAAGQDILDQTAQVAAPLDAFKAAMRLVKENEGNYNRYGAAGVPDVTAKTILATGSLNNVIHQFTLTTVMATGSYIFIYVATKPNADS